MHNHFTSLCYIPLLFSYRLLAFVFHRTPLRGAPSCLLSTHIIHSISKEVDRVCWNCVKDVFANHMINCLYLNSTQGPLQLSAYVGFHVDEVRFRSSPLRREWVIYAPSCDKRQPLIKATAAEAPPLALPKQKIRIKLRSYWTPLIEQASKQILDAAQNTNSKTMDPIPSPTKRRIYCVLRSPHVNKDSREHFEIRTHRRLIDIENPTAQTIDALMQLDIPAGVDVEVKL
ncbi:hypothetical protein O6H91_Y087400 [Diphasiastrum complanatum]|nr:hypothetical protein O6H91_Y087400 [Diphasiastrum complanatum]